MKFRLAIACCTLILAMPAAAQVEKPTGTRIGRPAPAYIPPNTRLADEDRARITTNDFARCVVQGDRKLVVDALAAPVDDPEANAKLARVRFSDCLADGMLHMPPPILRGAFFRALYLRDFDKREWRPADVPTDYGRFAVNKAQPAAASYFSMMAFADCLVRKDLGNSQKLVLSVPGSKPEEAALAILVPQMGPCLLNGMQVKFSRSMLSAVLAEALYRAAQDATAGTTAARSG